MHLLPTLLNCLLLYLVGWKNSASLRYCTTLLQRYLLHIANWQANKKKYYLILFFLNQFPDSPWSCGHSTTKIKFPYGTREHANVMLKIVSYFPAMTVLTFSIIIFLNVIFEEDSWNVATPKYLFCCCMLVFIW